MVLPTVSGAEELHLRFQNWFSYGLGGSGQVQVSVWNASTSTWGNWVDEGIPVMDYSGWSLKDVDLKALAARLEGYVGADIENLCREAAMISLRESKDAKVVTNAHFERAMKLARASTDEDTVKIYEDLVQEMTTAMSKRTKDDNSLGYYR